MWINPAIFPYKRFNILISGWRENGEKEELLQCALVSALESFQHGNKSP